MNTKVLPALGNLFQAQPGNYVLRGSFARGDAACGDIDIAVYNPGGFIPEGLLVKFQGLPINYWAVPLEKLENYLEVCLRVSTSLLESLVLKTDNLELPELIQRQQKRFYQERAWHYLLFLLIEEAAGRRLYQGIQDGSRSMRKRQAGSARTISRIVWAAKALFPQTQPGSTIDVLEFLWIQGILPSEIMNASQRVIKLLAEPVETPAWSELTRMVANWWDQEYRPYILFCLAEKLPAELIRCGLLTAGEATSEELQEVFAYIDGKADAKTAWLLRFGMAGHPGLNPAQLLQIREACGEDIVNNNILRNLIANPNFPEAAIPQELIKSNPLFARAYQIRQRLSQTYLEVYN